MIFTVESKKVKYSLGPVSSIEAFTFGEPGRRTFRLDVRSGQAFCSIWMEKEQLLQLGTYLKDVVDRQPKEERERSTSPKADGWTGGDLNVDFKAGQMLLSHDQESNSFYLQAYERETDEPADEDNPQIGETESVGFWVTAARAGDLGQEALIICAAGRPTCFLCGQPINPDGHACPRTSGHTVLEAG
ncbi:MAG TPA: hypothetical protein DHW65_06125 [Dehalococcoidia bacterium]|nr:hypothetical protein [Chloroflexota bacterium]MQF94810.1 DUF3090 family protein [SAR202 cluster bacterium]HAA95890.1 hypothetical protein [Dehalococcoidia bacterium]HCL25906.1 hypothetical protein [Dehalococcoidia bacterium]|tara:strand:+ start:2612 stop:3175 length:564 start_codon:yes stop_codon:yes gene_type:complete